MPGSSDHSPVFVGITTLPSRIALMRPCLESLLTGNLVPDQIFVSLPDIALRENAPYEIPGFFSQPGFSRTVEIIRTGQDYGSGTKLMGMLGKIDKPCYAVLADDDAAYKPFFLERLIEHQAKDHKSSFTYFTYPLDGMTIGQGVDGFSFWSPNLDGMADFYKSHVAGTDLMFHDDLWISFYLMSRGIKIRSLAHLAPGGEAKDILHAVNALTAETGRLSRQKLNGLRAGLFRQVDIPKKLLREFLTCARNSPCICGSGLRYKHCHGALD